MNQFDDPAFIDGWVSSGEQTRQIGGKIFLLGGRRYPFRVEYFKYHEKRGSLRIDWKQPGGEWRVISSPYLSPPHGLRLLS
ncbi:MAG: hypothetical protein HC845_10760 [Akkermansiaceae bacterium]|nr:hypothetical protein [Akkermansiaceae bacterium]